MNLSIFNESDVNIVPSVNGLAYYGKISFDSRDLNPYVGDLASAIARANTPECWASTTCSALMDMCIIDQICGNQDRGLQHQLQALEACRIYKINTPPVDRPLRMVGLVTSGKINANTPVEFLVQNSDVTLYLVYVDPSRPLPPIPEHDVAMVMVSDCEEGRIVLKYLESIIAMWPRPVINAPANVPKVGRELLYGELVGIKNLNIPSTTRCSRARLLGLNSIDEIETNTDELAFPIIIRPVDSHAGFGLHKIDGIQELAQYVQDRPELEFYISRFVEYKNADGLYRKFRVIVIDGKAYPCHLAISTHWMIHYVNAGMVDDAVKRSEEQKWMDAFETEFCKRHANAIAAIAQTLGLEYFGIDCAETETGDLLIFEACTSLVVHDMDPPAMFPYKSHHMQLLFAAFRSLLNKRAGTPGLATAV